MKKLKFLSLSDLPYLALGCGGIGMMLRVWLLISGVDSEGLIIRSHPVHTLVWVLTAVFFVILAASTWGMAKPGKYALSFPKSVWGAVGSWIGAAGMLIGAITSFTSGKDFLDVVVGITGLLAAGGLAFGGWCRYQGRHPAFFFHAAVCVHLALRLVSSYRMWSADPQLEDYVFQMLALVCLMLAAYYRAAFDANMGSSAGYLNTALSAVFFSCMALPGADGKAFFICMALWLLTNPCKVAGEEEAEFDEEETEIDEDDEDLPPKESAEEPAAEQEEAPASEETPADQEAEQEETEE